MVTASVAEVLRLFAKIDFWSVVGKDGIPILESPLTCVQEKRFGRYLRRRDQNRADKIWTTYVITGPVAAFQDERSYSRRSKVTKIVFNWYLRSEHLRGPQGGPDQCEVGREVDAGNASSGRRCLLCGMDIRDDTEKHLYVYCSHHEISGIRMTAERAIQDKVDAASAGVVRETLRALQLLCLQEEHRHKVWKGIISIDQGVQLSTAVESNGKVDGQQAIQILKSVRECMSTCGAALLEIRRKVWELGGAVRVHMQPSVRDTSLKKFRQQHDVTSIATTMGILTPAAAVLWELGRRKARKARAKDQRERVRNLPKVFVGEKFGKRGKMRRGLKESSATLVAAREGRLGARGEDVSTRLWDVH